MSYIVQYEAHSCSSATHLSLLTDCVPKHLTLYTLTISRKESTQHCHIYSSDVPLYHHSKSGVAAHLICLLLRSFPQVNHIYMLQWGIFEICHTRTVLSNLYLPYALSTKSKLPSFSKTRDVMGIGEK